MRNTLVLCLLICGVTFATGRGQIGVPGVQPNLEPGDRIAGGEEAVPHSWPWMAAVLNGKKFCGGVLVSDQHVLTAAHCVWPGIASNLSVRLGSHDLNTKDEKEVEYNVKEVCVHHLYRDHQSRSKGDLCSSDIAVIRLHGTVEYSDAIRPVRLPKQDEDLRMGSTYYVTGWGITTMDKTGDLSSKLKQASVEEIPCTCQNPTKKLMCVRKGTGIQRPGDSGGPVVHRQNGIWTLFGLVSAGPVDCSCSREVLLTQIRVSRFINNFTAPYMDPKTSKQKIHDICAILSGSAKINTVPGAFILFTCFAATCWFMPLFHPVQPKP